MSLATLSPVHAQDACSGFRGDVTHERALFQGTAESGRAGVDAGSAPELVPDRLYELDLSPQPDVHLAAPPGKTMLSDGTSAGLVRFKVATRGRYRISESAMFWIDVVDHGKALPSSAFQGRPGCDAPHKIVVYELPAHHDLVLQFSGGIGAHVRVAITTDATASP